MNNQNTNNINSSNKSTNKLSIPVNAAKVDNEKDNLRVSEPTILGPKESKKRKKRSLLLIIVLLIIVVIGIGAVYAISPIMEKLIILLKTKLKRQKKNYQKIRIRQ